MVGKITVIKNNQQLLRIGLLILALALVTGLCCIKARPSSKERFVTLPKEELCPEEEINRDPQKLLTVVSKKINRLGLLCEENDGGLLADCSFIHNIYSNLLYAYRSTKKSADSFGEESSSKSGGDNVDDDNDNDDADVDDDDADGVDNDENTDDGDNTQDSDDSQGGGAVTLSTGQITRLKTLHNRIKRVETLLYNKGGLFYSGDKDNKRVKEEIKVAVEKIKMM